MTGLRQPEQPAIRGDAGFALVAVMFISTLLSVVAFIFTTSVRSTLRSTATNVEVAKAEAAAEAGINLALLDLLAQSPQPSPRGLTGSRTGFSCALPAGDTVIVHVRDEAGRVDLNMANEDLLAALIAGADIPAGKARSLAAALLDFRDEDDDRRLGGGEAEDYLASGSSSRPKNAPFEATEEIGQVTGFDGELTRRLRPYVTIYSEQDGVDPEAASAELVAMLSRGANRTDDTIVESVSDQDGLPEAFRSASVQHAFNIVAEARTKAGARFARELTVKLLPASPRSHPRRVGELPDPAVKLPIRVLLWRRSETLSGGDQVVPGAGSMAPC